MESLEAELARAQDLSEADLADAIESIGFECTRCGACCKANEPLDASDLDGSDEDASDLDGSDADASEEGKSDVKKPDEGGFDADASAGDHSGDPHTATVFPDEVRDLQSAAEGAVDEPYDWRDVARPMPYGVEETADGPTGETFEWAIQTDACGNCTFYAEADDGTGACTVHDDRPLVCRTYPFSVALGGTSQPMGEAVDAEGIVRAHECEGLGRDIEREEAEGLATALKERAVRELEEAIDVRDGHEPRPDVDGVVVHDSEGAKRPDGTTLDDR